jgi:hypothetical protein
MECQTQTRLYAKLYTMKYYVSQNKEKIVVFSFHNSEKSVYRKNTVGQKG